jgi:hypothetical protein
MCLILMAGVSYTQCSRFFRRCVGVPFAASYSYSSLSSFSAKSMFRNPPCCVCSSRASSFFDVNWPPSFSLSPLPTVLLCIVLYQPLVPTSRNQSQLAACLRTNPLAPFCLHVPPRTSSALVSACYSYFRYPSLPTQLSSFYLRLRPYHYPLYTHSIPRVQHSQCNLLLLPCFCILCPRPPSSPQSCRLDLVCIVHGRVSVINHSAELCNPMILGRLVRLGPQGLLKPRGRAVEFFISQGHLKSFYSYSQPVVRS